MLKLTLQNLEATLNLGIFLGKYLTPQSVLLLEGDLGAGKTTLVQGIGKGLGIQDPIVSPTFILLNEYTQGRLPLYHFDLYRLEDREVANIYPEMYWEGIEVPPGITAIEWADRLPYKPDSYLTVVLSHNQTGERQAVITPVGAKNLEILTLLKNYSNPQSEPWGIAN